MKKVLFILFLSLTAAFFLGAEDLLVGVSYFTDEYDEMYTADSHSDYDLDFPFIGLIELYEEDGEALLYYDRFGEQNMEWVSLSNYSYDEYSDFRHYYFYSEILGDIYLYMGDEVVVDDVGAAMASYRFYSDYVGGMATAVGVIAAEYYQYGEDQMEEFNSIIEGIREGFGDGGY